MVKKIKDPLGLGRHMLCGLQGFEPNKEEGRRKKEVKRKILKV